MRKFNKQTLTKQFIHYKVNKLNPIVKKLFNQKVESITYVLLNKFTIHQRY